eukprot:355127-Chlamydomonas_euryale.AAC.8
MDCAPRDPFAVQKVFDIGWPSSRSAFAEELGSLMPQCASFRFSLSLCGAGYVCADPTPHMRTQRGPEAGFEVPGQGERLVTAEWPAGDSWAVCDS